ncbi:MAG TPA: heparinase II/III family protein [Bryobacteraceae bacterium]
MRRREFLAGPAMVGAALSAAPAADSGISRHPGLYYDIARIQQLRARLRADFALAAQWNRFVQHADQLVETPFVSESAAEQGAGDDANFGRPSQQIVDMAFTLGLAYHVTNREPYGTKLREALLHYAGYSAWHGPGFPRRTPPWHSELNTARFCVGMGAGYDALHQKLAAADRHGIADAIARMGVGATLADWLTPQTRIHALDSMGHNWWAVCVSSAGIASLALLGDDPRATAWLERVNEGIREWFVFGGNVLQNKSITFDPAGAFYESVNYANYALFEYLRFRLAYANVFPHRKQADFPVLAKMCEFFCQTFYPSSIAPLCVNFGDSPAHLQASPTIRLLIENGYSHPVAGWYLSKTKAAGRGPQALDFLSRRQIPAPQTPALPKSILYPDIGWAVLRNSWDDDATMLAVKSGFTWNHAHADAGSFILFHAGVPLIIDSGTCSYGNPEYSRFYVQSPAHNVILFNGHGEPAADHYRAVKFEGQLHRLVDDLGVKYVFADATGPMSQYFARNYRHWLWLEDVILIFDELLSYQEGTLDWLLHYEGGAAQQEGRVEIANGNARATIQFLYPEGLAARIEQGLADHQPDKPVSYLAFRTTQRAKAQQFVTAILPHPGQDTTALPTVQRLAGTDALGVRIQHGSSLTDVYLNLQADGRRMHLNSNNTIDGWETDAYLLAWTRPVDRADDPAAVSRFFVSCASYLRRDTKVYLDSLSKVFAVWEPGKARAEILGQKRRKVSLGEA